MESGWGIVESDREQNRFAASDDQGMFIMSRQGVVRSTNSPTIAINSNAAGFGDDNGLDGDDEALGENVVSQGIGIIGN